MSYLSTTLQTLDHETGLSNVEEVKKVFDALLKDIENHQFALTIKTEVSPSPGTPQQLIGGESRIINATVTLKVNY